MGGVARTGTAVVLFVDQVGSTAQLTAVGDIAADGLRRACLGVIDRAVTVNDGTIVKWTGDGAAATFQSATAALAAAIAMQRGIDEHNRRAIDDRGRLSIRVGISAGDVTWENDDFYGTPVVESARLESAAEADSILCADVVRILAGSRSNAELEPFGDLELKGLAEPVRAWTVAWRQDSIVLPPLPERLALPDDRAFAGRVSELGVLRDSMSRAQEGELRLALIGGEPGAGKSRLAREFARTMYTEDCPVLATRCDDGVGTPYWPFMQAIRAAHAWPAPFSHRRGDDPTELDRLARSGDWLTEAGLVATAETDSDRLRMFEAVLSWLEDVASIEPTLLVIDDLHWADPSSIDLLRFVMRADSTAQLLIAVTYRTTTPDSTAALERFLTDAAREDSVSDVRLGGLLPDEVTSLLRGDGDPDLAERLVDLTGGNPFFLTSLLDTVGGAVVGSDGAELTVPSDVGDFIGRRLQLLDHRTVAMLEVAAVSSADVDLTEVALVMETTEEALDAAVDEAVRNRLLTEISGTVLRYRFAHAIVRRRIYDGISPGRRAGVHLRIGRAIEARSSMRIEEHLDRLVHHFSRSGDRDALARAARYGIEAGRAAMKRAAHDQAVLYLAAAVEALEHPHSVATDAERCAAKLDLGVAQRRCRDPAARTTLLAVGDRAAELGEAQLQVAAALANTPPWATDVPDLARSQSYEQALGVVADDDLAARARLLADLSVERHLSGDAESHLELADEALVVARLSGDSSTLAHVIHFRHMTHSNPDTIEERLELALEVRAALGPEPAVFDVSNWTIQCFGAALEIGDLALADEALAALKGLSLDLRDVNIAYHVRLMQALRAIVAGRVDEGLRLADDMFEVGRNARQPTAMLWWTAVRFDGLFHLGRLDELDRIIRAGVESSTGRHGGANAPSAVMTIALARILAERGDVDGARRALTELAAARFAGVPFGRDWLTILCWAARIAWEIDDRSMATDLLSLIGPYGHRYAGNLTSWGGRVDGHVALLEDTLGETDRALERLREVAADHERLPAPAMHATTLADLGQIARRVGNVDADEYLTHAQVLAARFGLERVRTRVTRTQEGIRT